MCYNTCKERIQKIKYCQMYDLTDSKFPKKGVHIIIIYYGLHHKSKYKIIRDFKKVNLE